MAAVTESGVGTLTNPFRCVVCKVSVPNHKQKGKCAHCFVAQQVCESLIRKKQERKWKRIRWQKNEKAAKKAKGETWKPHRYRSVRCATAALGTASISSRCVMPQPQPQSQPKRARQRRSGGGGRNSEGRSDRRRSSSHSRCRDERGGGERFGEGPSAGSSPLRHPNRCRSGELLRSWDGATGHRERVLSANLLFE